MPRTPQRSAERGSLGLGGSWGDMERGGTEALLLRPSLPRWDPWVTSPPWPTCIHGMFLGQQQQTASDYLFPWLEPGKNNPGVFGSPEALPRILPVSRTIPARVGALVPTGEAAWGKPRGIRGADPPAVHLREVTGDAANPRGAPGSNRVPREGPKSRAGVSNCS